MKLIPTAFPDLFILEPTVYTDNRGFFYESFNNKYLASAGLHYNFLQDNHSKSSFGVVRGLHYQREPHAQAKLVRVSRGKVLDVVVDLRSGSPTYLKSFSMELSEENKLQLLVPRGFAHGFSVLSVECEFLYKCDNYYDKDSDAGIAYNDPQLQIDWKLKPEEMIISEKDRNNPEIPNATFNFPFENYTQTG
jgi:dTDP-4-dehydrorhamnose 3,5-epimerase